MNIRRVHLDKFRNHADSYLEPGGSVNVLYGKNGQGKTNILEALSCLCLTKSFYGASESTLVQFRQEGFCVEGLLADDAGMEYSVRITFSGVSGEKVFTVNGVRIERLSSVIGMFPVVILAPESNAITTGGPSDRRRFIDLVLSQLSRAYFNDLLEYRQVLRQRNRILGEAKQGKAVRDEILDPWDRNLSLYGARIVFRRAQFLRDFTSYMTESYAGMVSTREDPGIQYSTVPSIEGNENIGGIADAILAGLKEKQAEECRRGLSLVGPHRDDVVFCLNGLDLRKYASQGQHKTFLIALKLAEFSYLKERREETPVLLLDDVLSELDDERARRLLGCVAHLGQTLVTTTDGVPFTALPGIEQRSFIVEQGSCRPMAINDVKEATIGA